MPDKSVDERLDTIEEVARIAEKSAHNATRDALRSWRHGALIAFAVMVAALAYVYSTSQRHAEEARDAIVTSGRVVAVQGCNRDFEQTVKIRGVFRQAIINTNRQQAAGVMSATEAATANNYYRQQLAEFTLPDCRLSENAITDDPRLTSYPPPNPRYPR